MEAHSISRRRFLLGLPAMLVSPLIGGHSEARATKPVLLDCQSIPLNGSHMRFVLPSSGTSRLFLQTAADGFWLSTVDVTHGDCTSQVIVVGRRLLPTKRLELVLAAHTRGPLHIDLQHTYLPFSSSRQTMELWAGHPGVLA